MSSDSQLQVHRVQVSNPPLAQQAEELQSVGAVALLHRRLRGRYAFAIALSSVLGVIGGITGYKSTVPQFTSEGMVQISPTIQRTLYRTEENEIPPLFESFVSAQATFLQSSRVFAKAVESPQLIAVGWPAGNEGISKLRRSVSVDYRRGSQVITVQATLDDAHQAEQAVNAVINAYQDLYEEVGGKEMEERERALEGRRMSLDGQLASKRESILREGEQFGTDELDAISRVRLNDMLELDQKVAQQAQIIAQLESNATAGGEVDRGNPDLSLEYLATLDLELGQLLSDREDLDAQLKMAQRFGPRHMQTKKLEEDKHVLNARIQSRFDLVRSWVESGTATSPQAPPAITETSLPQAKALLARMRESRDALQAEVLRVGKARLRINSLKEECETIQGRLAETNQALEQLLVEKQNIKQGRIMPILGDLPTQPSKDRRLQLAVLGGTGGAGLGVGLVLLIGLLKPSYRYLDEIEEAETLVPVLGTLPNLNSKDDDLESLATLSVHHLRNMLAMQARPRKQGGTAFMITSARPGDGKTSLTVALGMSFAAQGAKVLMIDADLIGHGLSPTMRMDGNVGLRQAAGGGSLDEFIFPSRITNLSVLPAGLSSHNGAAQNGKPIRDGAIEAEHLSNERMNELLDQARTRFDIILVDTGPLMGSLEANVLATAVDRVVLTVPRGQDPRLLRAALGRLRSIGATCGGLVFNRATASDLRSSMSTISFHSQSMRTNSDASPELSAESRHALVRAILMSGQAGDAKGGGSSK